MAGKKGGGGGKKTVYRSSITGKFVTQKQAERSPKTTEKERVKTGS